MADGNPNPHIGDTSVDDRAEALRLVFSYLPPEERCRHVDEALASVNTSTGMPFEGLFAAQRHGRLVGAMFSQLQPDNNAMVWLPRLVEGEPMGTAAGLFTATWGLFTKQRIAMAQVVLPDRNGSDHTILQVGGFRRLTSLLYLVTPECVFPTAPLAFELDFESYSAANHHRFVRTLETIYSDTRDCADLESVESGEDALTQYRSTGQFDPSRWLLARQDGCDVGCLLLADHPRHDNMELLYLGLIPAVRGRGWGRLLARHAQWLTRLAGRARLVLAVDAANKPAVQTYTAMDFQTWQYRRLYVRHAPFVDDWHAPLRQVIHSGCSVAPRNSKVVRSQS